LSNSSLQNETRVRKTTPLSTFAASKDIRN
jgi:hypothetical protein